VRHSKRNSQGSFERCKNKSERSGRSQEKSPIEFIKEDQKKDHVLNYFSELEEPVMKQKLKAKTFVLAFWRPGVGLQPLPSVHG
jgi:hypothetical protein